MKINLRYCYMTAGRDYNENRHAMEVMKELGISYKNAIPQTLGDQWWFYDCSNVPDILPKYLSYMA